LVGELTVRFYGRLAEQFGGVLVVPVSGEGCTVGELRAILVERLEPDGAGSLEKGVRACVNDAFVPDSVAVRSGDEVEFLPPLSGG
jgi:molybdopterin converting factor small subunit